MTLNKENLKHVSFWESKGYVLPQFDIEEVARNTLKRPTWLHFGAGNIFRVFPAVLQQHLLNQKLTDTGIIVSEAFDEEILDKAYRSYDNLSLAITLKGSGDIGKEVVASVVESVKPHSEYERILEIFTAPSLQIVSFTITEKGYAVKDSNGALLPWIKADIEAGSKKQSSTIGIVAKLLFERYKAGKLPLALVSMDNCSHNGTLLKEAVMTCVEHWIEHGVCDAGFRDYVADERYVSFNWSMIDKITPRPAESVIEMLEQDGLEGMQLTKTVKNTFVAPFVNAEESQYLAIEDIFPNGRPALEAVGVLFSDKLTIDKIEKMKVCTCLNPLHTVLAIYGCMMGYTRISDEMKNPDLKAFVEQVGYVEGMPVVVDPGIINAQDFIKTTINVRFPNPFVPDTPQRIATDTSKKIPVRFGETLKAYVAKGKQDLSFLTFIPLFFAGYLRYLTAIDDNGQPFELSSDPNLDEMRFYVKNIALGDIGPYGDRFAGLLSRSDVFGVDLYAHGLGKKVESMFAQLNASKGAIAATLASYLQSHGKKIS
ncbi:MAG: mannitol dehydrogenase family protein [Sphaerochaetaceae bacterium]